MPVVLHNGNVQLVIGRRVTVGLDRGVQRLATQTNKSVLAENNSILTFYLGSAFGSTEIDPVGVDASTVLAITATSIAFVAATGADIASVHALD